MARGSSFLLFAFGFASLSFYFVIVFMLSLKHCICCFDFFMSRTHVSDWQPRMFLVIMVNA